MCISIHLLRPSPPPPTLPPTAQDLELKPVVILPGDTVRWMPGNNPKILAETLQSSEVSDTPISITCYWAGGYADGNGLLLQDPYLQPVASQLRARYDMYSQALHAITNSSDGVDTYTKGYEYFGIHHIVCENQSLRSSHLNLTTATFTCMAVLHTLYLHHCIVLYISPLRLSLLDNLSLAHVLKS